MSKTCSGCGNHVCCGDYLTCEDCGNVVCDICGKVCIDCSKALCDQCFGFDNVCVSCSEGKDDDEEE